MPEMFWPDTVMGWVSLFVAFACLVSMVFKTLVLKSVDVRLSRLDKRQDSFNACLNGHECRFNEHQRELEHQEQATLAVVEYLVRRDGLDAAKAMIAVVPPDPDGTAKSLAELSRLETGTMRATGAGQVVWSFGDAGVHFNVGWPADDAPVAAVEPAQERAAKPEDEVEEAQRLHRAELEEWDAELARAVAKGRAR